MPLALALALVHRWRTRRRPRKIESEILAAVFANALTDAHRTRRLTLCSP
jgi:hypothetical protein